MWLCTSREGRDQSMRVSARLDFLGIGHAVFLLLAAVERAALQCRQRLDHEVRTFAGQRVMQLAGNHVGTDGSARGSGRRAGVEALV